MTTFWIIAGLLLAGALLFVLPPLIGGRRKPALVASQDEANVSIYRDQLREIDADLAAGTLSPDQYQQARHELESRVLEDVGSATGPSAAGGGGAGRLAAMLSGVGIPVLALAMYFALGTPQGIDPRQVAAPEGGSAQSHEVTPEQINAMVDALARRLESEPANVEGWVMLARSLNALGRYPEAAKAYAKVVELVPDNGQLLADYADSLAMAQGRNLIGEPERLIRRALQADPANVKALALAGTVEFEKKNYQAAVNHWQQAAALAPPESGFVQGLQNSIAEARQRGGLKAEPVARSQPAAGGGGAPAAAGGSITGSVQLAPALAAKAAPTDTVFVFARAASGPRMPLAIVRKQVKDLPLAFALDDSMSMMPNMRLSTVGDVVVGARISKSGNATPQPGDLQSATQPARLGTSGLQVTIDTEVK
jgi:cytochrome c-type biogenesis protein CcmH